MDILSQITAKLGELMLEAEALLMEIRVLTFDRTTLLGWQFGAFVSCGVLIGAVAGWLSIVHMFGVWH